MIAQTWKRVLALYQGERYDEALEMVVALEKKQELPAPLLIVKGRLIQLVDNASYDLSDAREAFLLALEQDECSIRAMLELGWFESSVMADSVTAESFFTRALKLSEDFRNQALDGLRGCRE